MFFELVVATLIVYGLTLIIVQGTIFNRLRIRLSEYIASVEKSLNPSAEEVQELIESSHKTINKKLLKIYTELQDKVATTDSSSSNFNKLVEMFNDARDKITKQVFEQRQTYHKRFDLWTALKLQKLSGCMMCMGFWVGVFVCVMTVAYDISMFGIPFVLVSSIGLHECIISVFLLACMFSGTTWAINAVVDLFDEIKTNLGDIISKR